jgi:small subunit ribosomal protein S21
MIRVSIKENEPIERALKRFKKKLEKTGTIKEYRSRQYFTKPSIERREEIGKAIYKEKNFGNNAPQL